MAHLLGVTDKIIQDFTFFPMIDGDYEQLFAIVLQNAEHNKNALRRDAVKNNVYIEIKNKDDAIKYLTGVMKTGLFEEISKNSTYTKYVEKN
jgi:hypothetical protein